jgi:hypothetical protein
MSGIRSKYGLRRLDGPDRPLRSPKGLSIQSAEHAGFSFWSRPRVRAVSANLEAAIMKHRDHVLANELDDQLLGLRRSRQAVGLGAVIGPGSSDASRARHGAAALRASVRSVC